MEVFNQRLEQEYNASMVVTAPTVPYKAVLSSPKLIKVATLLPVRPVHNCRPCSVLADGQRSSVPSAAAALPVERQRENEETEWCTVVKHTDGSLVFQSTKMTCTSQCLFLTLNKKCNKLNTGT